MCNAESDARQEAAIIDEMARKTACVM
jgi:hypothetical protein